MAGKKSTEVQAALALVAGGMNPYQAAKEAGANEQSVYAAVRRAAAKPKAAEPGAEAPAPVASGNAALRAAFATIKADIATAGPARRASIVAELEALARTKPAAAAPSFARDYGDSQPPDIL